MDQSCTRAVPGEVGEEAKVNSGSKENKATGLLEELGAVPTGGLVTKQRRASLLGHLDLNNSQELPAKNEWLQGLCCSQSCSPCLCNDFWSHVGGCPTDSVQRAFDHRRQSEVSKLQRLGSI